MVILDEDYTLEDIGLGVAAILDSENLYDRYDGKWGKLSTEDIMNISANIMDEVRPPINRLYEIIEELQTELSTFRIEQE